MVTFGGGHLQVRYNTALYDDTLMPCGFALKVITALVVLPLLEDDLTPAYLPNLAIARSQLSVVPATQSDTDENLLFWEDDQLDLLNLACQSEVCVGDTTDCLTRKGCIASSSDVTTGMLVTSTLVQFGRMNMRRRIRTKRRLREREALFLITEYINNGSFCDDPPPRENWLIERNVNFRFAVR